jgi:hypothetical protein
MADAGWHPDPSGRHEMRYFDGTRWTDHVSDQGVVGADPVVPRPPATESIPMVDEPITLPPSEAERLAPAQTPWWKRKRWWAIGAVALVLIIAAVAGGSDDEEEAGADDETAATTDQVADATTTEAPTTVAPTTTAQPTTTAPPVTARPPIVLSGAGDDVVEVPPEFVGDAAVLVATHSGRSNFVVRSEDGLMVNEIGAYSGMLPLGFSTGAQGMIEIQADGSWTLEFRDLQTLERFDPGYAGVGDYLVIYSGDGGVAQIDHDGESNFVVRTYPIDGDRGDLLVNEIGPYSGRRPIPEASLLEINADGNWSITVS